MAEARGEREMLWRVLFARNTPLGEAKTINRWVRLLMRFAQSVSYLQFVTWELRLLPNPRIWPLQDVVIKRVISTRT